MFPVSRGAGIGGLGITVEGPSESKMSCTDNKDGSCSVEYIPFTPGPYDINITYGGEHVPGEGPSSWLRASNRLKHRVSGEGCAGEDPVLEMRSSITIKVVWMNWIQMVWVGFLGFVDDKRENNLIRVNCGNVRGLVGV